MTGQSRTGHSLHLHSVSACFFLRVQTLDVNGEELLRATGTGLREWQRRDGPKRSSIFASVGKSIAALGIRQGKEAVQVIVVFRSV